MIEKYKELLEQEGEYTAILTDLSKAFDCLPRDLIIAKLCTYRFGIASFRLTHSQARIRELKSIIPIAIGI